MKPNLTPSPLPDSPSDARDLNRGRDVRETPAHTPEPWIHIYGIDTHKVKRDAKGRMLGPVTMQLDDYDRAIACVNACSGMADPAATIEALRGALEHCAGVIHAIQTGNVPANLLPHIDSERFAREALALCARDGKGGNS